MTDRPVTTAVLLVGGFGTRLRPLTLHTPKQMLPVAGPTMLERVLTHLSSHGISRAVLALGYKADGFTEAYPDGTCAGVELVYTVEPEPLDTAGAIGFAAAQAGIDETFLACNADVLNDLDITELIAFHHARKAEGTIHLTPVDDPSRYGVVPIDAEGRVQAFIEKPPRGEAPTNWINGGTYVLEPSVLARIEPGRKVSIEREVFPAMVADGTLYALERAGRWVDAGTPDTYLQISLAYLDGTAGADPAISPSARVDPAATVTSSWVGDGAVVRSGVTLDRSLVLPGARVEEGAQVRESIIGPGSVVGAGATINGLSVIGSDVEVDPGAVLHEGAGARRDVVRLLVTGGAGFIGSHLVERLVDGGHHVDVIDDLSSGSLGNLADARASRTGRLTIHQVDVRDPGVSDLMVRREPEVVFHLAARADTGSFDQAVADAEINVGGSVNVLEGARRAGTRKVVFASSGSGIYAPATGAQLPLREKHPQQPLTPHGVAKKAVVDYLVAYRERHDLEFTTLVLAEVYGPRQRHGLVAEVLAAAVAAGEPVEVAVDDTRTCDLVYVDDVVDAFIRAADKGSGLVANIGTGVETSIEALVEAVGEALGQAPVPVVPTGGPDGPLRFALDPGRARIHLGWSSWTPLSDGLAEMVDRG